jgi:hypothetical protein
MSIATANTTPSALPTDLAALMRTTIKRKLTHSFPFPIYPPQGGLRQAPGRAA